MAVELYDGNNVLIRALTSFNPHNRTDLDLRFHYASVRSNHIWVWDGENHNKRRKVVYPAYKGKREPLAANIYAYINLWRELLANSEASQIEAFEWEADDVIATLARQLAARGTEVIIHSNDLDYHQLTANPRISIRGVKNPPVPGRWIPLYKACVGDSSDNIGGIPGFGKGTWEKAESHLESLEAAIKLGSPHSFETIPLPARVKNWLMDISNIQLVQNMLFITHFYDVPKDVLEKSVSKGTPNTQKAEELFRKYLI